MDLYVFATPYRITWDYYFSSREHTLKFDSWEEPAELEYVKLVLALLLLALNAVRVLLVVVNLYESS